MGFSVSCPYCKLPYKKAFDWKRLEDLESELMIALSRKLDKLSLAISKEIFAKTKKDPLKDFIDAIAVSDLSHLCNILNDKMLDTITVIFSENEKRKIDTPRAK